MAELSPWWLPGACEPQEGADIPEEGSAQVLSAEVGEGAPQVLANTQNRMSHSILS